MHMMKTIAHRMGCARLSGLLAVALLLCPLCACDIVLPPSDSLPESESIAASESDGVSEGMPETAPELLPDTNTMETESSLATSAPETEPAEPVAPIETTEITPVSPAVGTLTDAEFTRGYTDDAGVVYGRLLGAYPAGEGMTLQILASAEDFARFSYLSVEEYRQQGVKGDAFAAAMAGFDAAFFETHDLAVIRTGGGSGSLRFRACAEVSDGQTEITVTTLAPSACTMDLVFWAILVPVEKGTSAERITLRENTERYLSIGIIRPDLPESLPSGVRDPEEGIEPH